MKIAFVTLGCKLNYAETSTYERSFIAAGLEVVPWRQGADVFVVNTCTVTHVSSAKSRSEIRKLHRISPQAHIVVTGCYAQMCPDEVSAIEGVSLVFGATQKSRLVPATLALLRGEKYEAPSSTPDVFAAYSSGERTRSFLKVQDGCDNFCAYCTVPYARGRSRNLPICECVRNAREIASCGVREVVLTGVNTGDFGRSTGETFLQLLQTLNEVEGIERWRISSVEPNLLTEEIIDWIASGTKFLPHFHIPLQTGSDTLLRAMGRRYDTALFSSRLEYIRRAMEGPGKPEVFFGIDTMVGLPGESDELFRQTMEFIESVRPAFIHVFPYSRRPGTPAASMPGQVADEVKAERVHQLETLCKRLHGEFVARHAGMRARVLFESRDKGGLMSGYTENYIRVTRPWDETLCGRIVEVTI